MSPKEKHLILAAEAEAPRVDTQWCITPNQADVLYKALGDFAELAGVTSAPDLWQYVNAAGVKWANCVGQSLGSIFAGLLVLILTDEQVEEFANDLKGKLVNNLIVTGLFNAEGQRVLQNVEF